MTPRRMLSLLLLALNILHLASSFTRDVLQCRKCRCSAADFRLWAQSNEAHDDVSNSLRQCQWDRRRVMKALGLSTMTLSTVTSPSLATMPYDLTCLLDLPPLDEDSVRIYLCRHGQTENNRLRKVQGARVDPPINYNGVQQSLRLGSALAKLDDKCPSLMYHSNLIRSKETAEYAARNIVDQTIILHGLSILGEIDFGSLAEGQPVSVARGGMLRTYGAWAAGYVDARGEIGGESGREVMNRCSSALRYLVKEAEANGGSITAITHSKFLKVLLSVLQDVPLIQGAATQQSNCCIDVLDMKRGESFVTLGPKCNLLGGHMSNAPEDFELQVPAGRVVRVNEKRHLADLEYEEKSN